MDLHFHSKRISSKFSKSSRYDNEDNDEYLCFTDGKQEVIKDEMLALSHIYSSLSSAAASV